MRELWDKIKRSIDRDGLEVKVFAIKNVKVSYFRVYLKDDYLLIDRSKKFENSCNINTPRRLSYKQFEEIYEYYDRYVSGEKGIRKKLTAINNNTTYILSLINYGKHL